uniref:Minor tail protein n=1 Tax=Siphoviridae sp. ctEw721 TaxID=2825400 RepID=A0A8S5TS02_9CAUD|nr:MAG TPA: minor tail protein [Siphoviridae sp. ctEw721]
MISASEATTALTSSLKAFNLAAEDAIRVVDKLTKVDAQAAVSAGGIATALQKSATSAKLAGMSMDELIGSVSVIGEVTQQSMDTVGHAMKSILARYGNVKASVFTQMGLNDDGETSENINDIEKVLSKLGIRMRSSSTELRDITDVLDEVNEKWDTYDTVTKNALATAFGGTRMRENFLVLMENWNRVKELTEESANAAGTADEKYTAYMDSMEAATKRLQNAWEGFTQSLETSTVMKFLTNATAAIVENMDKLKYIITYIAAAGSAKIFDFFTNKGETGGFKGLIANIPFIGRGTKTNNILESIDKKVGNIEKGVGADSSANQTKNGGLISRIKTGFQQRADDKRLVRDNGGLRDADISFIQNYESGKFDKMNLTSDEQFEFYKRYLKLKQTEGNISDAAARLAADKAMRAGVFQQTAAVSGIATAATQLMTTKQVSGYGQTVEETGSDKALRTGFATAGSIAGAASALIPVVGPMIAPIISSLGSIAGEGLAGLISKWFHKDELEMKQRVADAKDNLKALTSINNSVSENSSLMKETFLDSSGVKNLSKYVDELSEKLGELSNDALSEFLSTVSTSTEKFKTISDLSNYILEANAEERKEIQQRIEVATAKEQLKQTIASQEEERNKIKTKISPLTFQGNELELQTRVQGQLIDDSNTKISGEMQKEMEKYAVFGDISEEYAQNTYNKWLRTSGALTFKGKTAEEMLENAKKFQAIFNKIDSSKFSKYEQGYYERQQEILDDYIKELADAAKAQDKLDSALIKSRVQVAFFQANLSDLTQSELQNLTIDGVAGKVVDALEKDGVAVRDLSGTIKDDYLTQIKLAIKSDEDLYSQLQTDTKSIGELMEVRSKFVQQFGENYDKVREDLDKGKLDHLSDDLKGLIYSADPERIKQFAQAWHMATSEVENFAKRFPNLNTATGLMSVDEVKDKYTKIVEIFSDISHDRTLSIEQFENILKNYPEYLNKIGDYEGLMGSLISSIGEESAEAYKNALFSDVMSSANYFAEFKKTLNEEDVKIIEKAGAKSFEDIYQLAQGKEELRGITEALDEYLNKVIEVENESPLKNFMIELKSGLLDEEINNLNEQKDALSKINDERKKEIEYIKAKYALEDARKEKKRVFRAGVGWTFESDETAISEAKEKVDSLDLERQQESLQYQIDSLEQQKKILEAIRNNEQLKKIEEALGANGISTDTADIAMMLAQSLKLDLGGRTKSYKTALSEKEKGLEKDVDTALQTYQTALDEFTKGDKNGRKWEDWNRAERENKLDNLSSLYSDYQKAYDAAKSFGVKNMERWSEDGKIISNAAESDKYSIDRIVVNGLGRHVLDWFKDDIKLRVGDKEFAAELSNSNMTVTQKELNEAYGQAPAKGDVFSHKGKYYVYRGDEWWEVLNDKGGTKFYEYMTGTSANASGTTSFPGGQTLINELGTEAVITPGGTLTALPSKTGIVPADITRNVWALGEVAPTLIARLGSLTQKPLAGNGANTTYEEGQYIDNLTMNVYPAKGDDFNKILEQARAQVRLTRRNN